MAAPAKVANLAAPPVRVDWRATFEEFVRIHGEPVHAGGRLLFADGWGHGAGDHQGPIFPPPLDPAERKALIRLYWETRLGLVRTLRQQAEVNLTDLSTASRLRGSGAPLMQSVTQWAQGEDGRWNASRAVGSIGEALEGLQLRLDALRGAEAECKRSLRELGG